MTSQLHAPLRLVFMGSDPIALSMLRSLMEQPPVPLDWVAVYTQPDRPTGRGMKLRPNAIKQWAQQQQLPVRQPEKCAAEETRWLAAQGVDLVLVMAYGQILRRGLLELPRLGALNLHASLLPRLRGASPIHTAIAGGYRQTGVSLMRMVPRLDAGPVADWEPLEIGAEIQAPELVERMAHACVPLMQRSLPRLAAGELAFEDQDESRATYCRIIRKADAALDFNAAADVLANRIRAFQPWPGALLPLTTGSLKIGRARAVAAADSAAEPGRLQRGPEGLLRIQCGDGALELLALQRPGSRMLSIEAFLRGHTIPEGEIVPSQPMEALETSR